MPAPTFADNTFLPAASLTFLVDPPSAIVTCSTVTAIAAGTTWNLVTWTAALKDNGATYDGAMTQIAGAQPSRVTATTAGTYLVVANTTWALVAAATTRAMMLRINSGGVASGGTLLRSKFEINNAITIHNIQIVQEVTLSAGDYIDCWRWQNSAGTLAPDASSNQMNSLSLHRIGT